MSEVMQAGDLADLYATMISAMTPVTAIRNVGGRVGRILDEEDIRHQCRQIDELGSWLEACCAKWGGYPDEFIASRFANMHYVHTPHVGYAYPDDEVWSHLLSRIRQIRTSERVVWPAHEFTRGEVIVWR